MPGPAPLKPTCAPIRVRDPTVVTIATSHFLKLQTLQLIVERTVGKNRSIVVFATESSRSRAVSQHT